MNRRAGWRRSAAGATLLSLLLSPLAWASEPQTSPYAGLEVRRIKALSEQQVAGLEEGAGLGYAMAAELNGHAGPKHVLELAEALEITDDQRAAVEASFERMKRDAVALGAEIVTAEEELDRRFSHRHLDEKKLGELTARIAGLEGRLRFTHLRAHLETDSILTPEQRSRYVELRGYGGPSGGEGEGHEHHGHGTSGGGRE